jgi:hypothetical protein
VSRVTHDDILLLRPAFKDIEYPIETTFVAFGLHVWADLVLVDLWCLGNHANLLIRIFFDMLLGAWPDQV